MGFFNYSKIVLSFILFAICTPLGWGFTFANSSKLSAGKWVKIKIVEDGVYEITNDELLAFGFADPSKVRIFGNGGGVLPEFNGENYPADDLQQVPIIRTNEKLCFLGKGCNPSLIQNVAAGKPFYITLMNPYSTYGAYFLTDNDYPDVLVEKKQSVTNARYEKRTSLNYIHHEKEECSMGSTGRVFFGEDLTSERSITINMNINDPIPDQPMMLRYSIGVNSSQSTNIATTINDQIVPFTKDNSSIRMAESEYIYYNSIAPVAELIPTEAKSNLALKFSLKSDGIIKVAKLDFATITYRQQNILSSTLSQLPIDQHNLSHFDIVIAKDIEEGAILMNVDNDRNPIIYSTTTTKLTDSYEYTAAPGYQINFSRFVFFNPNRTLKKVELVETVDNQNLHAASVPDMLIITTKDLIEQAQRVADLHREYDNFDVLVVDHTKIFNEFSSGIPDASAYRRLAKMFWERDAKKFKHILLFGGGSYDNRRLIGNKNDNYLLTYQSGNSNNENYSYTTDDYFTFLDDNAGDNHLLNRMRVSIGRMPVLSVPEAKNAVDKLIEYANQPVTTAWKNNILIIADQKDSGLHMVQSQGAERILKEKLGDGIQVNKIYVEAFTLRNGIAESAREKTSSLLTQGQLFVNYIGHGGPRFLTKLIQLWRKSDVKNTYLPNLPFFSLATCDVARFDSDIRGIAEEMFHQRNGGFIAAMASSRSVNAADNDILNKSLISNLFSSSDTGKTMSVGEALMNAKLSFTSSNINKLSFFLLGDPALKLTCPKKGVIIESVNEANTDNAQIYPMSENRIKGKIIDKDGNVNTSFNGTITATMYDKAVQYINSSIIFPKEDPKEIFFQNDVLTQASAEVVNGIYTLNVITPQKCVASNNPISLKLVAINTETGEMLNGGNSSIIMKPYDSSHAIIDNIPPTINTMTLDNANFKEGDVVSDKFTLNLTLSDNIGISTQSIAIGRAMNLILDNKESFPEVADHFQMGKDSKSGTISFVLKDLEPGRHSLKYSVSDLAGNISTRSIYFNVQPIEILGSLDIEEIPARDKATFTFAPIPELESAEVTINVTNDKGDKIWSKTTNIFPCQWDLLNTNGDRVAEGTYNFSGTIKNRTQSGHTVTKKIIVIKQ